MRFLLLLILWGGASLTLAEEDDTGKMLETLVMSITHGANLTYAYACAGHGSISKEDVEEMSQRLYRSASQRLHMDSFKGGTQMYMDDFDTLLAEAPKLASFLCTTVLGVYFDTLYPPAD